jgi:hypothetical protein
LAPACSKPFNHGIPGNKTNENTMTKKSAKAGAKTKKLGLKKETLKDLTSLKGKAAAVKGGLKGDGMLCRINSKM